MRGRGAERARELIRQICHARGVVIVRRAVSADHIHLLLSSKDDRAGILRPNSLNCESGTGTTHVDRWVLLRDGGRGWGGTWSRYDS